MLGSPSEALGSRTEDAAGEPGTIAVEDPDAHTQTLPWPTWTADPYPRTHGRSSVLVVVVAADLHRCGRRLGRHARSSPLSRRVFRPFPVRRLVAPTLRPMLICPKPPQSVVDLGPEASPGPPPVQDRPVRLLSELLSRRDHIAVQCTASGRRGAEPCRGKLPGGTWG